ncbi:MAG: hypothetical protein EAX96_13040 [Candidatus Lokiarchaeota archaeon]|nr:hypothetical protein [Candidatus Lokiarchaeota archaeon]
MKKPIKVFGVALDPNDNTSKLLIKNAYVQAIKEKRIKGPDFLDPFEYFLNKSKILQDERYINIGKLPIESWITPKPIPEDLDLINPVDYKIFLESGGCLDYRKDLEDFLEKNIQDEIPLMIGADHSSTGALISFIAKKYGKDKVSIIILDGHFDGIRSRIRIGLAKYATETNIETSNVLLNPEDIEKLQEIQDYYNCGTFMRYILTENAVDARNVFIIGNNDYPNPTMRKIEDEKVQEFVNEFNFFETLGVKFLPRFNDFNLFKEELQILLNKITTKKVLISTDVDVAAGKAVLAARFIDTFGFSFDQMIEIYKLISEHLTKNEIELIGVDFTEIEIQFLGKVLKDGTKDFTLEIFDEFLKLFFS